MKNLIVAAVLLLVAGSFLQAAVADPSAAETQAPVAVGGTNKPAVHKKKHKKTGTAVAAGPAVTAGPRLNGSAAVTAETAVLADPAVKAVLRSNPVLNALDQVILEANALSPLVEVSSGAIRPPTLGGLPGQWLKGVPPSLEPARFSLLVGVSSFKGEVGAALAVRAELPYGFQVEAGGVLPASVSGLAEDRASVNTPTPTPLTGQVTNLSQADLALLYPFYKREGFSLEAGVGLSVAQVTSQSEWATNAGTPEAQAFQDRTLQSAFSPLVELGGNYRLTPHLAIHLDVAYPTYSNNVRTPVGQPLALSFRGLAVRPMLAWRF